MTLKEFVIQTVSPNEFYQSRFEGWDSRNPVTVPCPFHSDNNPSFSLALRNGGARCHAACCGKAIGNIVHFEAESLGIPEGSAARRIYKEFIRPVIKKETLDAYCALLTERRMEWITESCGLTAETCRLFKLGLDSKSSRVTIPIYNRFGLLTNIRFYRLPQHRKKGKDEVKLYNLDGYGHLEMFPWPYIKRYDPSEPVFWMKAEKDTMLAIQEGLQAFCLTNGEGTWMDLVPEVFADFAIRICGDNDEAGIEAAEKRLEKLKDFDLVKEASIVKIVSKQKDFADWVLYDKGSAKKLLAISLPSENSPDSKEEKDAPEYEDLISIGRKTTLLNKKVKVRGIISGKSDRTYSLPCKFKVLDSSNATLKEVTIPPGRDLLMFVRSTDSSIEQHVKEVILKKPKAKLKVVEYASVIELEIIPAVTPEYDSPFVTQRCYYIGETIEANVPYEFEIIPTTEIRSQETIGLIVGATPITKALTSTTYTKEEIKILSKFQPEGDIYESLCDIANAFSLQYSQIYNRIDWHICAMLTWFSPLQFNFPNEGVQRGWLNVLGLGDTQTGKSEVVKKLREITNAGTFVNAENCTYVGLVGGAIPNASKGFMLRWGKIPLNNRQLVIVEELSGLSLEAISNLSEVRSSGFARLDKGGLSSETYARTRLIFLSNVRGRNRTLASYISGVKAIQDLVGQGEDISRFDLICTLTDREVSADVINAPRYQGSIEILDTISFKLLVRFIWSLKPEQIEITKDAYIKCLEETKRLSKIYHPSIPLFKGGSGRLKVARIAAAIACFQFNWDGKKIVVTPGHMVAATTLLQELYDKPSCGYRDYSEQMYHRDTIDNEAALDAEVRASLTGGKHKQTFRYLIHAAQFTHDELANVAGIAAYNASRLIGKMIASNILSKGEQNVWMVTPIGRTWMEKQLTKPDSKPVKKSLNQAYKDA